MGRMVETEGKLEAAMLQWHKCEARLERVGQVESSVVVYL